MQLTLVTPANAPSSGGASLAISGFSFAQKDPSATARVGNLQCSSVSWQSWTTLSCSLPASRIFDDGRLSVAITVTPNLGVLPGASNFPVVGFIPNSFSFDSPVVTRTTDVSNGATTGGTGLSLQGLNFGLADRTPSAQLGDFPCRTVSWTTSSILSCSPGVGYATTQSVQLTVASKAATAAIQFTFDAPIATLVVPGFGPLISSKPSWQTILGIGFGPSRNANPAARFGATDCIAPTWVTDTSMRCYLASGEKLRLPVFTSVASQIHTAFDMFSYDEPVALATRLQPANAPMTGTSSITVQGMFYKSFDVTPTIQIGTTLCETSSWNTMTQMRCLLPGGTGFDRAVRITMTDPSLVGALTKSFSYDAAIVSWNLGQWNGPTVGGVGITFTGINFGEGEWSLTPTSSVGLLTVCATTSWTSLTTAGCVASRGSGSAMSIGLTVAGVVGTGFRLFSYDPPVISVIMPANVPLKLPTTVTFIGQNFGASVEALRAGPQRRSGGASTVAPISLGPRPCASYGWVSDTMLWCSTASAVTGSGFDIDMGFEASVAVTIAGHIGTILNAFEYDGAFLNSVAPPNSPASGGSSMTVTGFTFLDSDSSPLAAIAGVGCVTSAWTAATSIACQLAKGSGVLLDVALTIAGKISMVEGAMSYDAPAISYAFVNQRNQNLPLTGGATLSLVGANFGNDDRTPYTISRGIPCATVSWVSVSTLSCTASALTLESSMNAIVSIAGQIATDALTFTYDAPIISFLNPGNGPTSRPSRQLVHGTGFGAADFSGKMTVGKTACFEMAWVTDTSLVCFTGAGSGLSLDSIVKVRSLIGTTVKSFSYNGCDGKGNEIDQCGVCGGGDECVGCDGRPFSYTVLDRCGVCNGDDSKCVGCDGLINSGKKFDLCMVCGGDDTKCMGCDAVPNSKKKYDVCSVCGGVGEACLPQVVYKATIDLDYLAFSANPQYINLLRTNFGRWALVDPSRIELVSVLPSTPVSDGKKSSTIVRLRVVDRVDESLNQLVVYSKVQSMLKTGFLEVGFPVKQFSWQVYERVVFGCDGFKFSGLLYDKCGICNGDDTLCAGCDGAPNSGAILDICGVCNGNSLSCLGCDFLPNSGKTYDVCGVCEGDSSSCRGCDGKPNSNRRYDACGVCGGNNATCTGCDGVPFSDIRVDLCGVCGGDDTACVGCDGVFKSGVLLDPCGICGGNGTSCAGCDGNPLSGKVLDKCLVCGGNDGSCRGCDGKLNSGIKVDKCGVCNGDDRSCLGCDGLAASGRQIDRCGICGGDDWMCSGCDGVPYSGLTYDICGTCGGLGTVCRGCDGKPNSNKVYDLCGVCDGTNRTCMGCDAIPRSGLKYDLCGICGGDDSACFDCHGVYLGPAREDYCGICNGTDVSCMGCAKSLVPVPRPDPPHLS